MHKVSIGTWAYTIGPYASNPVPLAEVVRKLKELRFDGLELGAFAPHPTPDSFPTKGSRQLLKDFVADNGLEFSGIAADMWSEKLVNAEDGGKSYLATVWKNLEFAKDLGINLFRVDTVQPPEILDSIDKGLAKERLVKIWKEASRMAAALGIDITWEFEPGFVFNRPSDIIEIADAVGEKNFGVMFDTCHAYTVGVVGAKQTGGPKETFPDIVEFARKLRGRINAIQIIDCDGSLHDDHTSTHNPIGEGNIDFPPVLEELTGHSGVKHDWWTIDLCFWPDAWKATEKCKLAVDAFNNDIG